MEMEHSGQESSEAEEMSRLRCLHDEAFLYISQGLEYEENNLQSAALQKYMLGEQRLQEALKIPVPDGSKFETSRNMKAKMWKHQDELKGRIASLRTEGPRNEAPPAYFEINGNAQHSFSQAGNQPYVASTPDSNQGSRPRSMMSEELFSIPGGVQLFQVSPDGQVSSPQPPTSLQVMCFIPSTPCTPADPSAPPTPTGSNNNKNVTTPPAWLQVGEWVCPLVNGQTVVLKTGYGAYMFPDIENNGPRASVGIIMSSEVTLDDMETFENFLVELTMYATEGLAQAEPPPASAAPMSAPMTDARFSNKVSDALVTGAGYLGTALTKGTEWTGYWVQKGAVKLRERISPEDRPMKIDPRVQTGLQVLRGASGAARKCSGFLVGKLSELTCILARQAAPHLRYHGNKLLVSSGLLGPDQVDAANNNGPTVIDDICIVAAGGVQSFAVLYMSLETAARQLASCLATETVQVVHHKYGSEASQVVDNAVSSVGNLALATNNIRHFGIKAIAKRTAKDTGKAVLHEYVDQHPEPRGPKPDGQM